MLSIHPTALHYSLRPLFFQDEKGIAADSAEDVVVYFGIIDILQEYNLQKKLEHRFKSIAHDGKTISAVDPTAYAERFMRFMRRVFQ